jgi:hypothetical protein
LSFGTEGVVALETVLAVTTGIVHVSPTDSVSLLQDFTVGSSGLDDTGALVT